MKMQVITSGYGEPVKRIRCQSVQKEYREGKLSMRPVNPIITLCAFLIMYCNAASFEQHGFHSGMTLAEAMASTQEPLVPVKGSDGNYSVGMGTSLQAVIAFCKGRLSFVSESTAGGVDAFAARSAKNIEQFGPPIVAAASEYTNDGLLSDVRLTWKTSQREEQTLAITSYQGRVSTSVSSSAHKSLCK